MIKKHAPLLIIATLSLLAPSCGEDSDSEQRKNKADSSSTETTPLSYDQATAKVYDVVSKLYKENPQPAYMSDKAIDALTTKHGKLYQKYLADLKSHPKLQELRNSGKPGESQVDRFKSLGEAMKQGRSIPEIESIRQEAEETQLKAWQLMADSLSSEEKFADKGAALKAILKRIK